MRIEETIKSLAHNLGADLCGIAPVERFANAPPGFQPRDIFPQAQSVVVLAKRFPEGPFHAHSPIPYSAANDVILQEVARLAVLLCAGIEAQTVVRAVPILSEPYEYWDVENREGRALLSLKHAGWLAGLGVMTANSLLTNERYGNRICLGAALLDSELEGDALADYSFDCKRCGLCINACPVHAIAEQRVTQRLCRTHSEGRTTKGYPVYVCNECRRVCPNGAGSQRTGKERPS
ncbi:MAG: 4Fe-4S binding protein [Phycisphaerales bacterium]